MASLAWYGQGLRELLAQGCQWAVALVRVWLAVGLVATWPRDGRHSKYWVVFACVVQTWVVGAVMYILDLGSPYFLPLWALSMALLLLGVVLYLAWPDAGT